MESNCNQLNQFQNNSFEKQTLNQKVSYEQHQIIQSSPEQEGLNKQWPYPDQKSQKPKSLQEYQQNLLLDQLSNQQKYPPKQQTSIQYLTQYLEFIYNTPNCHQINNPFLFSQQFINQNSVKQINSKITLSPLFQKCTHFTSKIIIHSIKTTKYTQVSSILYQIGYYKTQIIILNLSSTENSTSPLHFLEKITDFGSFGDIYKVQYNHQLFAVKCIKKGHDHTKQSVQERSKFLAHILKQYFFLTLFSVLEIGPKRKKLFGFDIILSKDCAEFSMELCSKLAINKNTKKKLKQNLKIIHQLRIVHRDIKPDNIMWSSEYACPVFIDFGGTDFIQECIGLKTKTTFTGTMAFTSQEVTSLLRSKVGYVDLYYNDVYGLKKSFSRLEQNSFQQHFPSEIVKIDLANIHQFLIIQIKYKIFMKQIDDDFLLMLKKGKKYCSDTDMIDQIILEFLIQFIPTDLLRKVFWLMSGQVRNLQKFIQLKDTFKDEISYIFATWHQFPFKQQKFKNQIKLYHHFMLQFGKLSQIDLRISNILLSKTSIQSFLTRQNFLLQNQNDQMIYCLVCILTCSFTKDPYGFTFNQKITLINQVFQTLSKKILLEDNQITKNFQSIIDQFVLVKFKSLVILLEFFLVKLWKRVPSKFITKALKNIIANLSFVGYPFFAHQVKSIIIFYAAKLQNLKTISNFEQKFQKIVLYWKVSSLIQVHNFSFFGTKKISEKVKSRQIKQIMLKCQKFEQELMGWEIFTLSKNEEAILQINKRFYQLQNGLEIQLDNLNLMTKFGDKSVSAEMKGQIKNIYNTWRQGILLVHNILPGSILTPLYLNEGEYQALKIDLDENTDCCLHFTAFLEHCRASGNMWRLRKMLKIVDDQIVIKQFSSRTFIDLRIYAAWVERDLESLKQFAEIILNEVHTYSEQNLTWFSKISTIIHSIIIFERQQFWQQGMWKIFGFWYIEKLIQKIIEQLTFCLTQDEYKTATYTKNINHTEHLSEQPLYNMVNSNLQRINSTSFTAVSFNERRNYNKIFDLIKLIIRKLVTVLRLAYKFIRQGFYKQNVEHLVDEINPCINLVTPIMFIRARVPQILLTTIVISPEAHKNFREKIIQLTKSLDNKDLVFFQLMQDNWMLTRHSILGLNQQIQNFRYNLIETVQNVYGGQLFSSKFPSCHFRGIPTPTTLSLYYNQKICLNPNPNIKDYQCLIEAYKRWKQKQSFQLFYEGQLLKNLFNAFIYCEKPQKDFLNFLLHLTGVLKENKEDFAIDTLYDCVREKFFCMCDKCFKVKPKNWNPLQLILYVDSRLSQINLIQNPYFALILYWMSMNGKVPYKTKRRLMEYVAKAMQYLCRQAKRQIFYQMYEIGYKLKTTQKGYFSQFGKWIYDDSLINRRIYPEYLIRLQYYFVEKTLKKMDRTPQIGSPFEQRLKLKKLRRPKWSLPAFVQRVYRQKVYRYHFILNGLNDKDYWPETYEQYIKEFLT